MFAALFRLPQAVWMLGLISLLNDSASELVYPLIPLYLASVLMAGPRALGLIEGVAEATGSLLKLFSGILTDRSRHGKPWVIAGYGVAAIARPLIALTRSWPVLLVLRFADRVGKGLRTSPRDAILAQAAGKERRGLAFGLHRAMDNTGAVVGPLTAAALLAHQMPLREIFLWAAIPGFLTLALTLIIREPPAMTAQRKQPFSWRFQDLPTRYKRYLLTLVLFTLGNSSNMFLLLRAKTLGFDETQVALLWALVSGIAALLSTPLSALSDRLGRTRLIVVGWAVYGLFYLILGLDVWGPATLWPLFAFYGVFLAATEGSEKALVADLAPQDRLGTAYGWFNLISGVMLLPASLVFGTLWQADSPLVAFSFSAGCALVASLLLILWVRPGTAH